MPDLVVRVLVPVVVKAPVNIVVIAVAEVVKVPVNMAVMALAADLPVVKFHKSVQVVCISIICLWHHLSTILFSVWAL